MQNFKKSEGFYSNVEYESFIQESDVKEVNALIEKLNRCFTNEQQNFCFICYYLYELKKRFDSYELSYYKKNFDSSKKNVFYEIVCSSFGLGEKQVTRFIQIYKRFMFLEQNEKKDDVVPKFKGAFESYSKSKLLELLVLSDSQIEHALKSKYVTPNSTVKEIRKYIKKIAGETLELEAANETIINEEEIPAAYDPSKIYEFSYFEKLTKNQLLNVVLELQKFAHKTKGV